MNYKIKVLIIILGFSIILTSCISFAGKNNPFGTGSKQFVDKYKNADTIFLTIDLANYEKTLHTDWRVSNENFINNQSEILKFLEKTEDSNHLLFKRYQVVIPSIWKVVEQSEKFMIISAMEIMDYNPEEKFLASVCALRFTPEQVLWKKNTGEYLDFLIKEYEFKEIKDNFYLRKITKDFVIDNQKYQIEITTLIGGFNKNYQLNYVFKQYLD